MSSHLASTFSPANLLLGNTAITKPKAQATSTTGSSSTSTSSGSGGLTSSTAGTTFLNLLVKELQNQDPDSPVDSTQMVGQMISLNQLDQLISINQTLSTAAGSSTSTTPTTPVAGVSPVSSAAQIAQRAELLNSLQNSSGLQAPSDPSQTLDLSTLNIPNGGK